MVVPETDPFTVSAASPAASPIVLVECPRDAMQGWSRFIPTHEKIRYLNALLRVGFDTLDFGSFVSAKAIPQMADTREVLAGLKRGASKTKLLAIVANIRGAQEASDHEAIHCLGYPFSVSPTFQHRNANSTMEASFGHVRQIREIAGSAGKELVVYLSMGFGNPYGDPWSEELVFDWADRIAGLGISTLSLADTVGLASPDQVFSMVSFLVKRLAGKATVGVHLHSAPQRWQPKIEAALKAGCRRFDGALKGIGGCPMAGDELVGNMNTEWLIPYFREQHALAPLDDQALQESLRIAEELFAPDQGHA